MTSAGRVPAISVIVPVYNVEGYLPACLDSLLAQTFDDFEIIVVDDGSTDSSAAIAERFAAAGPERIRVLHKPNGGLSDARNFGMDRSTGAYLSFVDADDLVMPDMLARLHETAVACDADLVLCGIENFLDGEENGVHYPEPDMSAFGHSLAEEPRLLYRVDASACDKLYSRGLFQRSGVRFPEGLGFEDVPTTYRLLPFASRIEKVNAPLYRYRRHRPGSISSDYGDRYLDLMVGFGLIDDEYREMGVFEANRDGLLRLHLTHLVAGRYPDLYLRADPAVRRRFISEGFALLDERFPGWRGSSACRALWHNPALRFISTHATALAAFCSLPTRVYLGSLTRLGAFDASR